MEDIRIWRRTPALLLLLGIAWNMEAGAEEISCADAYHHDTGVGRLVNNVWNKQAVGDAPYRQCILARDVAGGREFGWSWSWPADNAVLLSYPASVFGWKPWDGGTTSHPKLPIRIDRMQAFQLTYEIETKATGKHNLATALWLTRAGRTSVEPDPDDISADLNIWIDGQQFDPSGTQIGRATIDGVEYEVWNAPDMGDASAANSNRWNHIVYRATAPRRAGSLDVKQFLDDAVGRKLVSGTHYVSSIELGNEIMSGAGETWIRKLSLEVR